MKSSSSSRARGGGCSATTIRCMHRRVRINSHVVYIVPTTTTTSRSAPCVTFSVWPFCGTPAVAMSDRDGGSSAWRRRQRRLRSMLRHERQTVAMELAAALHHSRDVGQGTNDGLRAQTTASSGKRPGRPDGAGGAGRGSHGRLRLCSRSAPRGVVDGCWGDSVDGTALRSSSRRPLRGRRRRRRKEEEMQDILRRFLADLPVSDANWEVMEGCREVLSWNSWHFSTWTKRGSGHPGQRVRSSLLLVPKARPRNLFPRLGVG